MAPRTCVPTHSSIHLKQFVLIVFLNDPQDAFVGTYHRIHFSCNEKPVYQMGEFLLLRQGLQWVVASEESQVLNRCCPDAGCVGYALIAANEENSFPHHRCPDMPDGEGET